MEITEEQITRWNKDKESWFRQAENSIYTVDDYKKFIDDLVEQCTSLTDGTDMYQQTADASSAIAYAAINMCSRVFGLSGLQVGYIMWDIIDKLTVSQHDCGMKLVNYRDMLYPQYEQEFNKNIDKDTWEALQSNAKKIIEEQTDQLDGKVYEHLKSIVNGKVPFGYNVV